VNVCATFISTGIVTDVDRMGRILKLLISALDEFSSKSNAQQQRHDLTGFQRTLNPLRLAT